ARVGGLERLGGLAAAQAHGRQRVEHGGLRGRRGRRRLRERERAVEVAPGGGERPGQVVARRHRIRLAGGARLAHRQRLLAAAVGLEPLGVVGEGGGRRVGAGDQGGEALAGGLAAPGRALGRRQAQRRRGL